MPLTLTPCTPSDAPLLAHAHHAIWSRVPRNRLAYRHVPAAALLAMYEREFRDGITGPTQQQHTRPQRRHYLKVVDEEAGQVAACGVWVLLPEGYCVEDDEEAVLGPQPAGTNEALMRDFGRKVGELRVQHPDRRHSAHWLLWLLGTHPAHERRGAGALLVRWAFPHADAAGLRCYVDASEMGRGLYRKCGFEDVEGGEEMVLDLGLYEEGERVQRWVAMVREPGVVVG